MFRISKDTMLIIFIAILVTIVIGWIKTFSLFDNKNDEIIKDIQDLQTRITIIEKEIDTWRQKDWVKDLAKELKKEQV